MFDGELSEVKTRVEIVEVVAIVVVVVLLVENLVIFVCIEMFECECEELLE